MKKKLSYLLVFALVFSMLVPSFALAAGEDAKGHKYETSIKKLMALGVVAGDAGTGNIRPDDELTRAEFAKIAAYAGGYAKAAELLTGLNTGFKDVKADHWAAGYIALAASKGYLKGDPDGKFRPEDKISVAEAVTVLLRILGYNDNLPGSWPTDYITQAAVLGLFDNVQVAAGAKVKRGEVFALTDAVLSQSLVVYNKDTDRFDYVDADAGQAGVQTKSLIDTAFGTSFKTAVLTSPVLVGTNKDQIELDGTGVATSNLTVVGGDLATLLGHEVKYLTLGGKVVYVQDAQSSSKVVTGTLDAAITVTNSTYTVNNTPKFSLKDVSTDYSIAQGATFFVNGAEVGTTPVTSNTGAEAMLFLNSDGNVRFAVVNEFQVNGEVVTSITPATSYKNAKIFTNVTTTGFEVSSSAKVTLNGAAATLADLKADNVVYAKLAGGVATEVNAYDKKITGTVSLKTTAGGYKVKVNDVEYKVVDVNVYNGINFGTQYNFFLNKDDVIVKASAVNAATTSVTGIFVKEDNYTPVVNNVLGAKVYQAVIFNFADGKEYRADIAANSSGVNQQAAQVFTSPTTGETLEVGDVVTLTLNTSGKVTAITEVDDQSTVVTSTIADVDGSKVKPAGSASYYLVTDKTVIVDVYNFDETAAKVSDLALAQLSNLSDNIPADVVVNADGLTVKYIFVAKDNLTATEAPALEGVYVSSYSSSTSSGTDNYITVFVKGKEETVKYEGGLPADLVAGEAVTLTDSDKDGLYTVGGSVVTGVATHFPTGIATGGFMITGNANKFITTADTQFYVVTVDSLEDELDDITGATAHVGAFADVQDLNGADAKDATTIKIAVITGDTLGDYTVAKVVVVYKKK